MQLDEWSYEDGVQYIKQFRRRCLCGRSMRYISMNVQTNSNEWIRAVLIENQFEIVNNSNLTQYIFWICITYRDI